MLSSSTIKPGEKGKAVVKVDIKGLSGGFYKPISFFLNDPKRPKVTVVVRGTVKGSNPQ